MSESHEHADPAGHVPPTHVPPTHVPPTHVPPTHVPPAHVPPAHSSPAHGEHAAGGHGGGHASLGRNIGMTMAVLGVLLAFSSAMVGGQRTEFVGVMIEHTNATGQFQAVATKHRVL